MRYLICSPNGRKAYDTNSHTHTRRAYAARGWFVFPLEARGKRPITAHGFKDATTDADTIAAWWDANPAANIGLDCGRSGLVVIDLDGGEGIANWNALQDRLQIPPHVTAIARTGSGQGAHLYYRAPAGVEIRNSASKIAKSIDVRAQGGYVVLPPSVTEQPYVWQIDPDEISPLPDALLHLLTEPAAPRANGNGAHADTFTRVRRNHRTRVRALRLFLILANFVPGDRVRARAAAPCADYLVVGAWQPLDMVIRVWDVEFAKDVSRANQGPFYVCFTNVLWNVCDKQLCNMTMWCVNMNVVHYRHNVLPQLLL